MAKRTEVDRALRALDGFRRELAELDPEELDCVELESRLQEVLNGVGRACMSEVFERADTKVAELEYAGQRWGNRRESTGKYWTVFGEVKQVRSIYSKGGGGRVLVPLELRLGMVEGRYTPRMGRIMTRAIALTTASEAAELLKETGVAQVSKATLDRIPKAIAARYERHRDTINAALRERETVPDAAVVVQVALDGVMVPQDGEHARARGRKTEANAPPRHERRYGAPTGTPAPAGNDNQHGRAWHEATVGTLAFWDCEGKHLRTLYVGRMPESGQMTVASELELELHATLDQRPELDVCFASDGDAQQWKLLDGISTSMPESSTRSTRYLLDFYHAATYVHAAANAVLDESAARVQAESWKATLKEYPDGAARVLKSMRYFRDREKRPSNKTQIDQSIQYLAKHAQADRLNYKDARDANHPIGTGPTEAAAKTLVNTRMKRAGARFDQHGGQTILTFRSHVLSDRFDALWEELDGTYRSPHHLAA